MLFLSVFQFFGEVAPPPGVAQYGDLSSGGLIAFATNIIRLVTIVGGLWSLFNLIFAGFKYITAANDTKGIQDAWQSIYMSIIGLLIIVASYTIAAIIGLVLFGDPTYIINPKIIGI